MNDQGALTARDEVSAKQSAVLAHTTSESAGAGQEAHLDRRLSPPANLVPPAPSLSDVLKAANGLAAGLVDPTLLVTLHRDIDELHGKDGKRLGRSPKQYALRWGIFSMTYAATEAFFNDIVGDAASKSRPVPLRPDRLRTEAQKHGIKLFTNDWGVRTRIQVPASGSRSRWATYVGTQQVRIYLSDMKNLRDILSHGADPWSVSNESGAMWPLADGKGNSMRLMGAEGFLQACTDLAGQTILAYGGGLSDIPIWPEPARSGLSAEKRPGLPLLP